MTAGEGHSREGYIPAMSFTEIGAALGITKGCAKIYYDRGMAKLRAHPELFLEMIGLVCLRERMRANG